MTKFRMTGWLMLVCGMLLLVGCASGSRKWTSKYIRGDLSPEVTSIAHSDEERANRRARTDDTNLRQIGDDWDHIWLREHPVRLSIYPIP